MIGAEKKKDQIEEGYKLSSTGEIVPDYDTTIKYFNEGDVIKGTVVRIERDEVLVDVGYKSEGVIPKNELTIKPQSPKDICKVGEEIETLVMQKEDSEGRLILSKKRADYEKSWDEIEKASKENCTVKGTVIEVVRGGLILNIGVRSFLPASLIDLNRKKDLSQYMNQELECKVIEINRSRNNVVLSRKVLLTDDRRSEKREILEKFKVGDKVEGKISSIVDFGAFVDLGGIDGLIHISEISWEHINHPSEVLTIGQKVKVVILDIDKEKSRVSLGLKQTQDDTWKEKLKKFKIGDKIKGKVIKILPFGVFIEFDDNLEGLIHISELASKRVTNPKEIVEIGQELETKLMDIDLSRRRISLSVKQLEKEEEQTAGGGQQTVKEKKDKVQKPESKKEKVEQTAEEQTVDSGQQTVEGKKKKVQKSKGKEEEQTAGGGQQTLDKKERKKKEKVVKSKKEVLKEKKKISIEDEALLEKLTAGPTKIEDETVDEVPDANSLEDVLEQMKKSHGAKK